MRQYRWRNHLPNGNSVDVVCLEGGDSVSEEQDAVEYHITLSEAATGAEPVRAVPRTDQSHLTVTRIQNSSAAAFSVTVPAGCGLSRIHLSYDEGQYPLSLPGPTFQNTCSAAINGDPDAIETLLEEFATPPLVPVICGEFLTIAEVGALIENLTKTDFHAAGTLHSFRYDLVRSAIVSPVGLSVGSTEELDSLVAALDQNEHIGSVKLVDVLGDAMATSVDTPAATEALVADLGYDLATLERYEDDLFFACYLSQLVLTEGIRVAEGHVMQRRYHLEGDYVRRKTEAKNAAYDDRGRVWRELLCLAGRESLDEFTYVLANALYWSGEVSRTDSRMNELLLEAAASVAADIGLTKVEGRAQYDRQLGRGHRLRGQHCYSMAEAQFERAGEIAANHEFLPNWEPVYCAANVRSAELQAAGKHEQAIDTLDEVLERLFEYDVSSSKLNHIVHHLEGKKLEWEAQIASFGADGPDPVSLLEEAQSHYKAIGFERSRDRTARKLQHAKRRAPSSSTNEPTATSSSNESSTTAGSSNKSSSAISSTTESKATSPASKTEARSQTEQTSPSESSGSQPSPRARQPRDHVHSSHARDDVGSNPDLDDFLTPPDPDEVGSADLMTSPQDRDNSLSGDSDRI